MNLFLKRIICFFAPAIFVLSSVIYLDTFRIFGFYEEYYTNNFVGLNREIVCTKTYNHFREEKKFNSFIFGSSRSQAFKCKTWSQYLKKKDVTFHFDAIDEGIYGISQKVKYINELGDSINNALIVLDRKVLKLTHYRAEHLKIPLPIVSKESKFEFYSTFFKASLDPKFIMAYIDFSIFKKFREYMRFLIDRSEHPHTVNNINCDMWYGIDKSIKIDSVGYYNNQIKKGIFYKRPVKKSWESVITDLEIEQLKKIKEIFSKQKTKYKIIISPVYDQIPIEEEQLGLLNKIFGKENIYNFSGKNKFTESYTNYYEASHFRQRVTNEIMKIIHQ